MRETCAVTSTAERESVPVVRDHLHRRPQGFGRLVAAIAAGLLLDVAFPPHDLWWLAPVPVAILTVACRGVSARRGALLGLVAGLGFFVPLLVWTGTIAGAPAWLALALLEASFFAPLG